MDVSGIISTVCSGIIAIITTIIAIIKQIKSTKVKVENDKLQTEVINVEKKHIENMAQTDLCFNYLIEAIQDAEKFKDVPGEIKKEFVKAKAIQFCTGMNIEYNEKLMDCWIENYIKFSKTVNARDKDIDATKQIDNQAELSKQTEERNNAS